MRALLTARVAAVAHQVVAHPTRQSGASARQTLARWTPLGLLVIADPDEYC